LFDKKIEEASQKARIEYASLEKKNSYDIGVLFAEYLFETEILEVLENETHRDKQGME